MKPIFESLSSTYPTARFLYVDVDESPEILEMIPVKLLPTFFFARNGKGVGVLQGADPESLRNALDRVSKTAA